MIPGAPGSAPKRGSSEVHLGKLADGRLFLATIDPWHGTEVAVCVGRRSPASSSGKFGPRTVIDDTLDDGHALWVADVDGDGNDEVFAGHRGKDARVSVYRFDGKTWARTVLDPNLAAQDLRGGDIDGDGTPDVVAIGGKSHNVVWFRPVRAEDALTILPRSRAPVRGGMASVLRGHAGMAAALAEDMATKTRPCHPAAWERWRLRCHFRSASHCLARR